MNNADDLFCSSSFDATWRRSIERPSAVPDDAEPLLWEGVIFGDYWITPRGEVFKKNGQHMPEKPHHTGYPRVSVIKNGKSTSLNVHNLVAYTFKPIPSKLIPVIDHIDVDKTNHSLENLEFVGQSENTRRAYQEGANKSCKPVVAFTKDDEGIEHIVKVFYSIKAAEEEMLALGKKTRNSLRGVINGTSRRKKAYGYRWRYATWEEYEQYRDNGDSGSSDPGDA